jgi:hypothetical protein
MVNNLYDGINDFEKCDGKKVGPMGFVMIRDTAQNNDWI